MGICLTADVRWRTEPNVQPRQKITFISHWLLGIIVWSPFRDLLMNIEKTSVYERKTINLTQPRMWGEKHASRQCNIIKSRINQLQRISFGLKLVSTCRLLRVAGNKRNIAEYLCYTLSSFRLRYEVQECIVCLLCIAKNWNCAILKQCKTFNACSGNAETPGAKYSICRRMLSLIKCIHPTFWRNKRCVAKGLWISEILR